MSYQVLARKWRPHNFQEVVGQQHILTALSNGLEQNRLHHAYLFSGTRGVGKTSIARILAKSLNCELGVTNTPCGVCENCIAIDQGRFVDLLEIDAASRTKVDDTRELLDNVQYKPAQGRYKVYLIDEVHMLSKSSFNALLKTLEEPPEYVKFLLATTDPQKLPITVLSRCLQFHLKAILPDEIEKQLEFILLNENAKFEKAALHVIAKAADGSMRDALSLTDQALAFGAGTINYSDVLKMLGTIDNSHLNYLLHFISSGNVEKVFQKIEEFVHLGVDFIALHQELANLCYKIALKQLTFSKNRDDLEQSPIKLLATRLSPEEVQLYYQIAVEGFKDSSFAPSGKIAFEMTVMRLLAFKPANYVLLDETKLSKPESTLVNENQTVISAKPSLGDINEPAIVEENVSLNNIIPQVQSPLDPIQEIDNSEVPSQEIEATPIELEKEIAEPAPLITAPLINDTYIAPNIPAEASIQEVNVSMGSNEAEPIDETVDPQMLSNSRNMLRSHRLKRIEAKKILAATVNNKTNSIVADTKQPIASNSKEGITQPIHSQPQTKIIIEPASSSFESIEKNTLDVQSRERTKTSPVPESGFGRNEIVIDPELPPLELYENYQSEHSYPEYENNEPSNLQESTVRGEAGQIDAPFEIKETQEKQSSEPSQTFIADQTFITDESIETPEIDVAKFVEDKLTDPWSIIIQKMRLNGLMKVLANDSVMVKEDQNISLTLKPKQQHLLNNNNLCEQLQTKLRSYFGDQTNMYISVGESDLGKTPNESSKEIYNKYLINAKLSIQNDPNIQIFLSKYNASVFESSVIPL